MITPRPNTEHAYKVLDFLIANPERHDQGICWEGPKETSSETAASVDARGCFAAWAVALAPGWSIRDEGPPFGALDALSPQGRKRGISEAADEILSVGEEMDDEWVHGIDIGGFGPFNLHESRWTVENLTELIRIVFGPRPKGAVDVEG
jgi:hypothetical protein